MPVLETPMRFYFNLSFNKKSIDVKLFENERNHRDLTEVLSSFKEYLDKQVPMFEDLLSFYKKVDRKTKKKILSCIFSKKEHLEEKKSVA